MSLPEIIAFDNRQKIVGIARDLLSGRLGVIAARQIVGFYSDRVGWDKFDPDFATFVAIESETDALPVGDSRKYWAPDALAQKDLEIAQCEEFYRSRAAEAASRLIARFRDEKRPESAYSLMPQTSNPAVERTATRPSA